MIGNIIRHVIGACAFFIVTGIAAILAICGIAYLVIALAACSFTGPEITNDANQVDASNASSDGAGAASIDAHVTSLDALHIVTLSDTSPDVATEAGAGCVNSTNGTIYDGQWYRAFALSDPHWGVTGSFTVTDVGISVWKAEDASNVTIEVGTYSGVYPTAAFQPLLFTSLATIRPTIANMSGGVPVPVDEPLVEPVTVAAGAVLAVKVAATNGLQLGATGAAVYQGGFFGSSMCAHSPPVASASFIVTITGKN